MISKRIFFILCFIFSSILSYADNEKIKPKFQNEEETLFFRRIVEFFEEGEYELVKDQLIIFLKDNTKSPLVSYFNAFLGDIYMKEEGFEKALSCYTKIQDQKIKEKIELNLLQCFYELKFYDELKDECLNFLKTNKDSDHSTRINFLLAEAFYQKASLNNFENTEDNLENAKKYFNQLINTDYEDDTKITLCHIHHLLKEHNLASNLYLDLAQKNETKRAKYLFSAAKEQAYFDKELAIKTLDIIIKLNAGKEKEAEFEKLLILFDSKNYKEIVLSKDNVSLPDGKYYLLHFFLGRSHFFLKHFDESKKELFKFIKKENQSTKFLEIGLLTLMQIAEETNDPKIFSDAFNIFNNKFDENENLSKSLQVKASLLKKNKLYDEAEVDFFRLENQFKIKTEEFNYEYEEQWPFDFIG